MKCKYCNGDIKGKICIKCLMPIDVEEKEKRCNNGK